MRKGSPERRAFFYAIAAVIFKNKEQKCKTRSKNALQMSVFCPFLNDFSPFLCIYATKNRIFMNKNAVLVGRGGFEALPPFTVLYFKGIHDCAPTMPQANFPFILYIFSVSQYQKLLSSRMLGM